MSGQLTGGDPPPRSATSRPLTELEPADRAEIIAEYLHAGRRRSGADANADQARVLLRPRTRTVPRRHPSHRRPLPRVPHRLRAPRRVGTQLQGTPVLSKCSAAPAEGSSASSQAGRHDHGVGVRGYRPAGAGWGRPMTGVRAAIFDLDVVIAGLAPPNSDSARVRVRAFPSTVILVNRLRDAGLATALVTASRNGAAVLEAAGVLDLFDVVVDGNDAEHLGLRVKPGPDFLRRGGPPVGCDSRRLPRGRGRRCRGAGGPRAAGSPSWSGWTESATGPGWTPPERASWYPTSPLSVRELLRLDRSLRTGRCPGARVRPLLRAPWVLTYHGFDPAQEGIRETLCTLANGYLGTRGAAPECGADAVHYPGTYLAGVYNRLETTLDGQTWTDEHMVNAPNWLPLWFAPAEGEWLSPGLRRAGGLPPRARSAARRAEPGHAVPGRQRTHPRGELRAPGLPHCPAPGRDPHHIRGRELVGPLRVPLRSWTASVVNANVPAWPL